MELRETNAVAAMEIDLDVEPEHADAEEEITVKKAKREFAAALLLADAAKDFGAAEAVVAHAAAVVILPVAAVMVPITARSRHLPQHQAQSQLILQPHLPLINQTILLDRHKRTNVANDDLDLMIRMIRSHQYGI